MLDYPRVVLRAQTNPRRCANRSGARQRLLNEAGVHRKDVNTHFGLRRDRLLNITLPRQVTKTHKYKIRVASPPGLTDRLLSLTVTNEGSKSFGNRGAEEYRDHNSFRVPFGGLKPS